MALHPNVEAVNGSGLKDRLKVANSESSCLIREKALSLHYTYTTLQSDKQIFTTSIVDSEQCYLKNSVSNQRSTVVHSDCTSQYLNPHFFFSEYLDHNKLMKRNYHFNFRITYRQQWHINIATLFRSSRCLPCCHWHQRIASTSAPHDCH